LDEQWPNVCGTTANATGTALGAAGAGQLTRMGGEAALLLGPCCAAFLAIFALARRRTLTAEHPAELY
jgi:hypothetical protein